MFQWGPAHRTRGCAQQHAGRVNRRPRLWSGHPWGVISLTDGATVQAPRFHPHLQNRLDQQCAWGTCTFRSSVGVDSAEAKVLPQENAKTRNGLVFKARGCRGDCERLQTPHKFLRLPFASSLLHPLKQQQRGVKCNDCVHKGNRRNSKQRPTATVCATIERPGGIHPGRWRGRAP